MAMKINVIMLSGFVNSALWFIKSWLMMAALLSTLAGLTKKASPHIAFISFAR